MKRIIALTALAALISGCSKVSENGAGGGEHSWTKPGVLRIAVQAESKNLNTLLASNTTDAMQNGLLFEPMVTADDKGNLLPALAKDVPTLENGGISKDGLTITYHLVSNATWTDGVPVTSKDVKFSWQAMMNNANNVVSRHGFDQIQSVDTPDATTVILHLKQKFAPIVSYFFGPSDSPTDVAPEHILSKFPNVNQIPFNNEPIGDGPFKLAEWVKGDHMTFVANENYYRGAPKLKQIVIRFVPDENTTLNLLRTHAIDWMFEASYSTYPQVKTMSDIVPYYVRQNGYEQIQLNTAPGKILGDKQIRTAIAYAIDKKDLLEKLTFGQETLATEDLPDWMWAYYPQVTVIPHDVAKARQILAADGYAPGPDGIMTKGGEKLSLLIVSNVSNATRRKATVLIQAMLKQIGIDSQIKYFDGATLFAPAPVGILQTGKFDIGLSGWFSGVDPDDSSTLTCANRPPGGNNYSEYCDKAMDDAQKIALESYDQPTRKKAYAIIEENLAQNTPAMYFWWIRYLHPISVDFKGFDPNPVTESWNAYQWSI